MQLNYDKLLAQLQHKLAALYLVHGDEPLLVQEASLAIRQAAKQAQFTEQLSYYIDQQFNWNLLADQLNNLSLFSEKQLIELQLNTSINAAGNQLLTSYIQQPNPDKLILLTSSRLTNSHLQAAWCQALSKQGVVVTIWPIQKKQLPTWLKQRLAAAKLKMEPTAIELLLDYCNGNILTIQQLLEKLQLMDTEPLISRATIEQLITDSAHYTVFDLTEACLQGDPKLALRILYRLKLDNTELTLILWALTRELRKLAAQAEQQPSAATLASNLPYPASSSLKSTASATANTWYKLLVQCAQLDEMIKGAASGNSWDSLQILCLQFATRQTNLFSNSR